MTSNHNQQILPCSEAVAVSQSWTSKLKVLNETISSGCIGISSLFNCTGVGVLLWDVCQMPRKDWTLDEYVGALDEYVRAPYLTIHI